MNQTNDRIDINIVSAINKFDKKINKRNFRKMKIVKRIKQSSPVRAIN